MPRKARTTVRWSDQEYRDVRGYAEGRNISLSELIREVLMKQVCKRYALAS
jgi:hypothetical protein